MNKILLHMSGQWNQYLLNKQVAVDLSNPDQINLGPIDNMPAHSSAALMQLTGSLLGTKRSSSLLESENGQNR